MVLESLLDCCLFSLKGSHYSFMDSEPHMQYQNTISVVFLQIKPAMKKKCRNEKALADKIYTLSFY